MRSQIQLVCLGAATSCQISLEEDLHKSSRQGASQAYKPSVKVMVPVHYCWATSCFSPVYPSSRIPTLGARNCLSLSPLLCWLFWSHHLEKESNQQGDLFSGSLSKLGCSRLQKEHRFLFWEASRINVNKGEKEAASIGFSIISSKGSV